MLIVTTSSIDGKTIKEYRGIVFGEVVSGMNVVHDFTASITNFTGGRAKEYEGEISDARADAISEMMERAKKVGANALIGVKVDVETISTGNDRASMIIVTATGTAVVVE